MAKQEIRLLVQYPPITTAPLTFPVVILMQRFKVLIVEDDGDMRGLYCFLLANEGYQVKAVRNGLEAITEIQINRPDVVMTDIAMPTLSGLELIKAIRAHGELADLPVIAMTSFSKDFRERALEAGADGAIGKPTEVAELCEAIHSVVSRSRPLAPQTE